jgi:hypothetical protein
MAVVVSVIVIASLVVLLAVIVHVVVKTVRWLAGTSTTPTSSRSRRHGSAQGPAVSPPAYGHLPTPADPVGALGSLSPDADLSSRSMRDNELLGE